MIDLMFIGRFIGADGLPHHIHARLVAKNGDLIVRIRDDCKPFNAKEAYELLKDDPDREK